MRIVVTGSAGYIGQPLVATLVDAGHEVIGIDLRPGPFTMQADIRELNFGLFDSIEAIVHLAGVSFAPEWSDTDDIIWDANVEGTRRLTEHAEMHGVQRFILASSASIFEGKNDAPATIDTRPMPVSAYGRSKACAERILRSSAVPQRLAVRKGTICGLGPNPRLDLVMNAMMFAAIRTGRVFVNGVGTNNRPLLRLSRAVHTYAAAATTELAAGMHLFNICDDNVNVIDVAHAVCKATGAELIHREYTGRPRSYLMQEDRSPGFMLDVDDVPIRLEAMVQEVLAEFKLSAEQLPVVSADPRLDRLEEINREMRGRKVGKVGKVGKDSSGGR